MLAPYVWNCHLPLDLAMLASRRPRHRHPRLHLLRRRRSRPNHPQTEASKSEPPPPSAPSTQSTWHNEDDLLIYRVTGTGFLHHMVRNLVGTFVEAARSRIPPDTIPHILAARNRTAAGPTAPARGLFLVEVLYSDA